MPAPTQVGQSHSGMSVAPMMQLFRSPKQSAGPRQELNGRAQRHPRTARWRSPGLAVRSPHRARGGEVAPLAQPPVAAAVAQIFNLPYRGFAIRWRRDGQTVGRMQFGDTAEYNSALRRGGFAAPWCLASFCSIQARATHLHRSAKRQRSST
jgi:hypothetical protein